MEAGEAVGTGSLFVLFAIVMFLFIWRLFATIEEQM